MNAAAHSLAQYALHTVQPVLAHSASTSTAAAAAVEAVDQAALASGRKINRQLVLETLKATASAD